MPAAQRTQTLVRGILADAFGPDLVKDDSFQMSADGERILYDTLEGVRPNPTGRIITSDRSSPGKINQFSRGNREKAFMFFLINKDFYRKEDYLFSLEIIDYPGTNEKTITICEGAAIDGLHEDLKRIRGTKNYYDVVAIKIGDPANRCYDALKHYIISSDNRTYNKVVRNIAQYIEVNGGTVSQNISKLPHNLLVFGAPGTGKSWFLKKEALKAGTNMITAAQNEGISPEKAEAWYHESYVTRVTFYEDYSYENFVGCYKPVPHPVEARIAFDGKEGSIIEDKITYQFVGGPFIDTYIKAIKDPDHSYFLIIEEINRAKAASVFGDMFQLLDRENGVSEYEIKPEAALRDYLDQQECPITMRLPGNMYIWATMNSADQGVMPLDSAFTRRWASKYMDISGGEGNDGLSLNLPVEIENRTVNGTVLWGNLRAAINAVILQNGFDEDRCIGEWYLTGEEIAQINAYYQQEDVNNRRQLVNPLIDKLLYYLHRDIFRRIPAAMFRGSDGRDDVGLDMSSIRHRVRSGAAINRILRIELPIEPPVQSGPGTASVPAAANSTLTPDGGSAA